MSSYIINMLSRQQLYSIYIYIYIVFSATLPAHFIACVFILVHCHCQSCSFLLLQCSSLHGALSKLCTAMKRKPFTGMHLFIYYYYPFYSHIHTKNDVRSFTASIWPYKFCTVGTCSAKNAKGNGCFVRFLMRMHMHSTSPGRCAYRWK